MNWLIASLATVGGITILWFMRKIVKGLIYIAGVSFGIYYIVTYGPQFMSFLNLLAFLI